MNRLLYLLPLALLAASLTPATARAQPGTLDPSFGDGGITLFDATEPFPVSIQPDGKILAAGLQGTDAALWRFLPDGTPDSDFGTGGEVVLDLGGPQDFITDLAVLPDGKILAAGAMLSPFYILGDDAVLARFLPDGTLDASFGVGGIVREPGTVASDTPDAFWSVSVRPDGRIVAGGTRGDLWVGPQPDACYAVQYLADGARDPAFGTDGVVSVAPEGKAYCLDGDLLPDGRYVLTAAVGNQLAETWGAIRLLEDGALDASFGTGGVALADAAGGVVTSGVVSPDGSVTVGGGSYAFLTTLVRFTPDGTLDASFGTDGVASLPAIGPSETWDLALQSDGKIILAGVINEGATRFAYLARVLPGGAPDPSFGTDGITRLDLATQGSGADFIFSVALDARGRIVATGAADYPEYGLVARFENNPALLAAPVDGPVVIGPAGGSFAFTVTLANPTNQTQTAQVWTAVTGPVSREPVLGPRTVTLPPGATVTHALTQQVPGTAPEGTYVYRVRVGSFPSGIFAEATFAVLKEADQARSAPETVAAEGWTISGWDEAAAAGEVPTAFALHAPRPNPFAARAAIAYDLPEATAVRLSVYDVLGREVARLVDGPMAVGTHAAVLDGQALPSGIYLVQLEAGGFFHTQRVTVLR
jgi:uncharacterized delta-60 repeat protein